jgi:hypothetical protein
MATKAEKGRVSVAWLEQVTAADPAIKVEQHLARFLELSSYFGLPRTFDYWLQTGELDAATKTELRALSKNADGSWIKIYDTESIAIGGRHVTVTGATSDLTSPTNVVSLENSKAKAFQEALLEFIGGADFKPTMISNIRAWLNGTFLVIGLHSNLEKEITTTNNNNSSNTPAIAFIQPVP